MGVINDLNGNVPLTSRALLGRRNHEVIAVSCPSKRSLELTSHSSHNYAVNLFSLVLLSKRRMD